VILLSTRGPTDVTSGVAAVAVLVVVVVLLLVVVVVVVDLYSCVVLLSTLGSTVVKNGTNGVQLSRLI
jgi:hypothetical protein